MHLDLHLQSIVAVPEATHGAHVVGGPLRYGRRILLLFTLFSVVYILTIV